MTWRRHKHWHHVLTWSYNLFIVGVVIKFLFELFLGKIPWPTSRVLHETWYKYDMAAYQNTCFQLKPASIKRRLPKWAYPIPANVCTFPIFVSRSKWMKYEWIFNSKLQYLATAIRNNEILYVYYYYFTRQCYLSPSVRV